MAFFKSSVCVGVVLTAVLAMPSIGVDRSGPYLGSASAVAQEATPAPPTYLDDLLARAQELLEGPWEDPQLAIAILEELIAAGSVEAAFELAGFYIAQPGDPANFERARELLTDLTSAEDPLVAARAWISMAEMYLAESASRDWSKALDAYRQAADLGDTWAMINLAAMLVSADAPNEPDFATAIELLSQAAAVGDGSAPRAWYNLASLYRETGETENALAAFQSAADLGDSAAMVNLASMLGTGEGGAAPDFDAAKALLDRVIAEDAANAPWAWVALAELYLSEGDAHDPARAVDAYQQAADLGDTSAMISLATLLAAGEGVNTPEVDTAVTLLSRAAAVGDANAARAWSALAALYQAAANNENAVEAYRQAADLGNTAAMINLAAMVAAGEGLVAPDFATAKTYLDRAIAAEDDNQAWAWSVLAGLYLGEGETRDPAKAVDAYRRAADLGDTSSMISLALMLASGEGVAAPDVPAAIASLSLAIEAGGPNATRAANELAGLYRANGDLEKAVDAYARAAGDGNTAAMINLATMVGAGEGVDTPDFARATSLLEQAIGAEDENAGWAWSVLAQLYITEGDTRDPVKAREGFAQAAERGDTSAMISLAGLLASGEGGDAPAVGQAIDLLIRAAEVNDANAPRAWDSLANLYYQTGDLKRALQYYELLADTGDGYAHLSAAEIISLNPGSPNAREALVAHFRQASAILGNGEIAQAMLRINSVALYAAVQALLVDAGYEPGSVDGVFGPRTEEALAEFCVDRNVAGCLPSIVTLGLLTVLLEPVPAQVIQN